MIKDQMNLLRYLLLIADMGLVAAATGLVLGTYPFGDYGDQNRIVYNNVVLAAVVCWGLALWNRKDCYSFRGRSSKDIIRPIMAASLKAIVGLFAYLYFIELPLSSRSRLFLSFAICVFGLILIRFIIHFLLGYYRSRGKNLHHVLIVGDGKRARSVSDMISANRQWGARIIGFIDADNAAKFNILPLRRINDIPVVGNLEILPRLIKARRIDWVIFAAENNGLEHIRKAVDECHLMGIKTIQIADMPARPKIISKIVEFDDRLLIVSDPEPHASLSLALKNILDRILALAGLIVLSPLMVVIALSIKISSPGPVLFKQKRLGLHGRAFVLYKFRTMVRNADKLKKALLPINEMDGPVFKIKNDPRVTPLGGFLRKTSLDELPQLFNVLKGDMSIVGPRPPLAGEVKRFEPWQRRKLSVKPGITCLWQISGRNQIKFQEWMKMDLEYIDRWSLWLDFKIMARTIPAILTRRGAY